MALRSPGTVAGIAPALLANQWAVDKTHPFTVGKPQFAETTVGGILAVLHLFL